LEPEEENDDDLGFGLFDEALTCSAVVVCDWMTSHYRETDGCLFCFLKCTEFTLVCSSYCQQLVTIECYQILLK